MHWTLAFHATDRPEDPPIGVWKFGRTDFDDANIALQQRDGYAYARISRLELVLFSHGIRDSLTLFRIMPTPLREGSESLVQLSMVPESDLPAIQSPQRGPERAQTPSPEPSKKKQTQKRAPKAKPKNPKPRGGGATAATASTKQRGTREKPLKRAAPSKKVEMDITGGTGNDIAQGGKSQNSKAVQKPATRKGLAPKRKPKRPLVSLYGYLSSDTR